MGPLVHICLLQKSREAKNQIQTLSIGTYSFSAPTQFWKSSSGEKGPGRPPGEERRSAAVQHNSPGGSEAAELEESHPPERGGRPRGEEEPRREKEERKSSVRQRSHLFLSDNCRLQILQADHCN